MNCSWISFNLNDMPMDVMWHLPFCMISLEKGGLNLTFIEFPMHSLDFNEFPVDFMDFN